MSVPEAFWDFSLRTYGTSGVAPACLALQDDYALDVNVLLYCCWTSQRGIRLSGSDLERVLDFSRPWAKNIVQPLRTARNWMQSDGCAQARVPTDSCLQLRESIKAIELASERLQQRVLESMTGDAVSQNESVIARITVAAKNLQLYLAAAGAQANATVIDQLAIIVTAGAGADSTAHARQQLMRLTSND